MTKGYAEGFERPAAGFFSVFFAVAAAAVRAFGWALAASEGTIVRPCCSLSDAMELEVFLDATPDELSIELTRDGDTALSDTRTVEYDEIHPRGPECGGGCRQSHFEVEVEKATDD